MSLFNAYLGLDQKSRHNNFCESNLSFSLFLVSIWEKPCSSYTYMYNKYHLNNYINYQMRSVQNIKNSLKKGKSLSFSWFHVKFEPEFNEGSNYKSMQSRGKKNISKKISVMLQLPRLSYLVVFTIKLTWLITTNWWA